MQILHVVEQAYRATIEEQDDPVLWFAQVLRGAAVDSALLLRGSAVNYLVFRQDASGVAFGAWRQSEPPRVAASIVALLATHTPVLAIEEDLADRGIRSSDCVAGIQLVPRARVGEIVERYDHVWQW